MFFTNNHSRIEKFSEELEFGEVQINGVKYAIYLPHGGIKNSGIGHDCSHLALEDYLIKKRVSQRYTLNTFGKYITSFANNYCKYLSRLVWSWYEIYETSSMGILVGGSCFYCYGFFCSR